MKKSYALHFVLLPLILCFLAACGKAGDSRTSNTSAGGSDLSDASMQEVVDVYFEELEKLPVLLRQVQDAQSAQSTGPAVQALTDRLQACVDRLESWDKEQVGMTMAAQAQRFMNLQQTMMPEVARISSDPALATHLQKSLKIPTVR